MIVKELMHRAIAVVRPESSIMDAARTMRELDTGVLPVGTGKGLIGVLTYRDITVRAAAAGLDPTTTTVDEVMSLGVLACRGDEDIGEAGRTMRARRLSYLLVLDSNRRPIGVLRADDLQRGEG